MNKLDIKLYCNNIYEIDDIHYGLNSIKYFNYQSGGRKIRYINKRFIGIHLYIINKKK